MGEWLWGDASFPGMTRSGMTGTEEEMRHDRCRGQKKFKEPQADVMQKNYGMDSLSGICNDDGRFFFYFAFVSNEVKNVATLIFSVSIFFRLADQVSLVPGVVSSSRALFNKPSKLFVLKP